MEISTDKWLETKTSRQDAIARCIYKYTLSSSIDGDWLRVPNRDDFIEELCNICSSECGVSGLKRSSRRKQ